MGVIKHKDGTNLEVCPFIRLAIRGCGQNSNLTLVGVSDAELPECGRRLIVCDGPRI